MPPVIGAVVGAGVASAVGSGIGAAIIGGIASTVVGAALGGGLDSLFDDPVKALIGIGMGMVMPSLASGVGEAWSGFGEAAAGMASKGGLEGVLGNVLKGIHSVGSGLGNIIFDGPAKMMEGALDLLGKDGVLGMFKGVSEGGLGGIIDSGQVVLDPDDLMNTYDANLSGADIAASGIDASIKSNKTLNSMLGKKAFSNEFSPTYDPALGDVQLSAKDQANEFFKEGAIQSSSPALKNVDYTKKDSILRQYEALGKLTDPKALSNNYSPVDQLSLEEELQMEWGPLPNTQAKQFNDLKAEALKNSSPISKNVVDTNLYEPYNPMKDAKNKKGGGGDSGMAVTQGASTPTTPAINQLLGNQKSLRGVGGQFNENLLAQYAKPMYEAIKQQQMNWENIMDRYAARINTTANYRGLMA
jgi:hypothetical protein